MSDTPELLNLLQEEAAEVIQIISKIRRFGFDSGHPSDPTVSNRNLFEQELGDFIALFSLLSTNKVVDAGNVAEAVNKKFNKLVEFNVIRSDETNPLSAKAFRKVIEDTKPKSH